MGAEVNGHDVRAMSFACALERPVTGIVDVDSVVMGTNSQHGVVRRECHHLNPLLGVIKGSNISAIVSDSSDVDRSVITSHSNEITASSNAS